MPKRHSSAAHTRLTAAALAVMTVLLLTYPVDWAVWRLRMAFGTGMGTENITETTAATLKGNHFEVYDEQSTTVTCSRSLLPEAGAGACWWVQRHPQVVHQY